MKKKIYTPKPLTFPPGYFFEQDTLGSNINMYVSNWKQQCSYQLSPHGLNMYIQLLQLCTMQLVYIHRKSGAMRRADSPGDSFTIAVVEACEDKASFGHMKIQAGDILFFDDSQTYYLTSNGSLKYFAITITKSMMGSQLAELSKLIYHHIQDTDARLTTTLHKIFKRLTDSSMKTEDVQIFQEAEEEILTVIMELLSEQTPIKYELTAGEKKALDIRDNILEHMDGENKIEALAKQYDVSEQTMQNSFKLLFGYTPKRFFLLLKLNLVHHELMESNPDQTTVSKIARKWGFTHMGRVAGYYKELYGENPSQTLKTPCYEKENMEETCVARQEEMS